MKTITTAPSAPAMPVAWPIPYNPSRPVKRRFPATADEPRTIGYYLEPLLDIASRPDRAELLKLFMQETIE